MSNTFELNAAVRETNGKAHARRMRRLENQVPAVIYGAGKEPLAISLDHTAFTTALQSEAIYSHILTLKVDGKAEKVVLKDLQRHPYKPVVMHADFLRINAKEKLTMQVPVHFINEEEAAGVKDGGVASHLMNEVEITCLPANLPEFVEVDVAGVALDSSLHLSDITLPKGVELTADLSDEQHNQAIFSIHKTRAGIEADAESADAADESEEATSEE
jgi:large subunit ribosomal protein L25